MVKGITSHKKLIPGRVFNMKKRHLGYASFMLRYMLNALWFTNKLLVIFSYLTVPNAISPYVIYARYLAMFSENCIGLSSREVR